MGGRAVRHWVIVLACWGVVWSPGSLVAADNPIAPIQAELVKRLHSEKLTLGDSVLARVQVAWKGASCELRAGDILQGRVVLQKPYSKADKTTEIAILFDKAQCGSPAMRPMPLTVEAIVSADRRQDPSLQQSEEYQPLSEAVGLMVNGGMRSVSNAASTVYYEPTRADYVPSPGMAAPKEVKPGQVVGISHLKLLLGKGPEGVTILASSNHELSLEMGTQFVLMPNAASEAASNDPTGATGSDQPARVRVVVPDPPKIADETEVCAPPTCEVAFDDSSSAEVRDAELVLPLNSLGYLPPSAERDMLSFDYQAGVGFLGPGQLLFTFNPHVLVKRSKSEVQNAPKLRMMRAVAVDLATRQVVKSVDWRVADSQQYFWPLGTDQILVHVGDELRVYGQGLQLLKKIPLGAPLAFVRTSPSSAVLAVGLIHERHTPEIHRELEEEESREPEEDVEVRVLDAEMRTITTIKRSSRQALPVLFDDGEVRVFKIGTDQWRIVKFDWSGKRRVLAQASSGCMPTAQSLPGDLLFVVGCDHAHTDGKWYRVLRDGKVLLKASSSSLELEHRAVANPGGNLFAIGIAQTKESMPWQVVFRTPNLKDERVALYSAKNGKRVLALNVSPVVPAVQTFALSPGEEELAVLTTDHIALYRIPARPPEH